VDFLLLLLKTSKNSFYKLTAGLVALVLMTSMTAPAYATLDLIPEGIISGTVGVSSDGCGTNQPPCNINQDVPAGATVLQAYLYAVIIPTTPPATLTVDMDGTNHVLALLPQNTNPTGYEAYRADVTAEVTTELGSDAAHVFVVDDSVTEATGNVDGVGLVIVYSDASLPVGSVLVFDGGLDQMDMATFNFGAAADTSDPDFAAEMRLGISFSQQGGPPGSDICGTGSAMFTHVDVNSQRLTSCAGNLDDGDAVANGALFTIGGVGDNIGPNPADPFQEAADGAQVRNTDEDERYDVEPFIQNGDTSMTIMTDNPSNDDFIWLSIIRTSGLTIVDQPQIAGSILPLDTTALLIGGLFANALWMAPVLGGAAATATAFYIKSRKN
jgi:hypothetical protein